MSSVFIQLSIVISTALLFLAIKALDAWVIAELHFIPGVHWISLAAGICVLATLLFGPIGTVGMLVAYFLRDIIQLKSVDVPRTILDAVAHSVGPYFVYLAADRLYGLQASLANLTSKRLLVVIVACSAICPALQSIAMQAPDYSWVTLNQCLLMFAGNLVGALLLTYVLKVISTAFP
ncbi:hypothetical protein ABC383_23090 [Noviherbaspirillum sp. 1P10PC]|uniref:hypothetical protein n=1 Tax=Noviherbaspirillum sp. 1P10PC TaxID=3132292 RepID=UPI00399FCC93